ncbi:hypothetical protein RhiirA1_476145 [Rhizophagus irregularis]|uniref:Uncharacterized protein n=1 Tax=Rhizophagus irregularis TaxID=588596 RepID=A0A2N0QVN2_9GLOM|nr:hypothetical protein RhiirA1_476145 [Rhizophagus irregularis]
MKYLFLQTRNPPDHAFNKITQKILGEYTESSGPTDEEVNNFISRENSPENASK